LTSAAHAEHVGAVDLQLQLEARRRRGAIGAQRDDACAQKRTDTLQTMARQSGTCHCFAAFTLARASIEKARCASACSRRRTVA